jgi:hypothetical protein
MTPKYKFAQNIDFHDTIIKCILVFQCPDSYRNGVKKKVFEVELRFRFLSAHETAQMS